MAFLGWLKQSTAVTIKVGPFLDETDGRTPETTLTLSQGDFRLSKNGGNIAQKNEASSATHDELGYYDVALDTTDTNTLGVLMVAVDEAGALPVRHNFAVAPANVWDSLFGADRLQVDVREIGASVITAPSIATNAFTSGKFATAALTADAFAADVTTEIWAGRTGVTSIAKNVALTNFPVHMRLTAGGNGTGLTVTGEISKDGGAFAALADTSITEIGSTGIYKVDVAQAEMNADWCVFRFTATGCHDVVIAVRTQA